MSDGKEYCTKNDILICWNPGDYAKRLVEDGYQVVTSLDEFENRYIEPEQLNLSDKRKTKKKTQTKDIYGLIILCELTWDLAKNKNERKSNYSAMSGIEFIKWQRKKNIKVPIVFVSFLSRCQQINLFPKNEIISTPALGHFYQQLPSKPEEWLNALGKTKGKLLCSPELEDIKRHFCTPENMLAELKHDLNKYRYITEPGRHEKFEKIFRKIEDILGYSVNAKIKELRNLQHDTDEKYQDKIKQIGDALDDFSKGITEEKLTFIKSNRSIQIVLLDDEIDTDLRLNEFLSKMKGHGLIVHCFQDTDKAFEKIQADNNNHLDIIICDLRIWNNSEVPRLMSQMQGYTFLNKCAELGRTYTYVVFSALPRNFLMQHFGIRTETLYKNGVLANDYSMVNFIANLIEWGESNKISIEENRNYKKVFVKCLNWYRNNVDKESIDVKVQEKVEPIIDGFKNFQERFPQECIGKKGFSCKDCTLNELLGIKKGTTNHIPTIENIKSEYKLPENWNPENEDHIQNLIVKFAARRLFLFYYYSLRKLNCFLSKDIADNLVEHGVIRFEFDNNFKRGRDANDRITGLMEDTARYLWIKKTNILPTREEKVFLRTHNLN